MQIALSAAQIRTRAVDHGKLGVLTSWKYVAGAGVCFDPLNLDNCKFHIIKDERHVSKMEGKTKFSRRLKQFDDLIWLADLTPLILGQIYATGFTNTHRDIVRLTPDDRTFTSTWNDFVVQAGAPSTT